jgi:hypothetical protein
MGVSPVDLHLKSRISPAFVATLTIPLVTWSDFPIMGDLDRSPNSEAAWIF